MKLEVRAELMILFRSKMLLRCCFESGARNEIKAKED